MLKLPKTTTNYKLIMLEVLVFWYFEEDCVIRPMIRRQMLYPAELRVHREKYMS